MIANEMKADYRFFIQYGHARSWRGEFFLKDQFMTHALSSSLEF
jgi:hypothetical protein